MLVYSSEQEHLFDTKFVNFEPFIGETDEKLTSIKLGVKVTKGQI